MIYRVCLKNFKRFENTSFDLYPQGISLLAGGNNSGKSTLLHALAVWEFCRFVLEMERGRASLLAGYARQGCVHLGTKGLPVLQTRSGWWISKNVSQLQTVSHLEALCTASGLEFGKDVRFPVR